MKIFFTILLTVLSSLIAVSQPSIEWQLCLGGEADERGYDASITRDGGFIVLGTTRSSNGQVSGYHGMPWNDTWVVKLDSNRNIQWQIALGGTGIEYSETVLQTFDGGYILGLASSSNDGDITVAHGSGDAWVVKLDSAGGIEWQKCYGGSGNERINSLIQTPDSGYVFCGFTVSNDGDVSGNHGDTDAWLVKLDQQGGIEWQKCYGGSEGDRFFSIQKTSEGGYIAGGGTSSPQDGDVICNYEQGAVWIVKLDVAGDIDWSKCYSSDWGASIRSIRELPDDGYVFFGRTVSGGIDVSQPLGGEDGWVGRLDTVGNLVWDACIGDSGNNSLNDALCITSDTGWVVANNNSFADPDTVGLIQSHVAYVARFDNDGTLNWQLDLQGYRIELRSVTQLEDGGLLLCGSGFNAGDTECTPHGNTDIWLLKLDAFTAIQPQVLKNTIEIYPNPFTDNFTLNITAIKSPTRLFITNALGQRIQQAVFTQSELRNPQTIDLSLFPPGVYAVTLRSNSQSYTQKIIKQ